MGNETRARRIQKLETLNFFIALSQTFRQNCGPGKQRKVATSHKMVYFSRTFWKFVSCTSQRSVYMEENSCMNTCSKIRTVKGTWGPFLESPDNFSGPESYFMCAMFTFKTQILLVLKAEHNNASHLMLGIL